MQENQPQFNKEGQGFEDPEAYKKEQEQKDANELADAKEADAIRGRLFQPAYADDKLAEKAAEVFGSSPEAQKIPLETSHEDSDPTEDPDLKTNPRLWVEKTIRNPKLAAFDQINGLIQALEDQEKNKAA